MLHVRCSVSSGSVLPTAFTKLNTLKKANHMSSMPVRRFGASTGAPSIQRIAHVSRTFTHIYSNRLPHTFQDRQFKQYLAIAPFPSRSHAPCIGAKAQRPAPACVQIWTLRPRSSEGGAREDLDRNQEPAEMKCEMVLCLDSGPAQEIRWCPLPAHDRVGFHADSIVANT